ncbi:MAG: F0F1 ATP synthase subunit gamma [Methanosarcina sp.]
MSETTESLRKKLNRASELQSVVRTMKALAASNIGQYERSVEALADYYKTVELGLGVCFRESISGPGTIKRKTKKREEIGAEKNIEKEEREKIGKIEEIEETGKIEKTKKTQIKKQNSSGPVGAVIFGSDQGLVGQFNDIIVDYALKTLEESQGKLQVWAVGERVFALLENAGLKPEGYFSVPNSVKGITPLIGQILIKSETLYNQAENAEFLLFYNRPKSRILYEPVNQRLLPLDEIWQQELAELAWPTRTLPQVIGKSAETLRALIDEYLFVSLFKACAESLASENASRLSAMQRADKNIEELLEELNGSFYRLRQSGIDEELFEVISGFEALSQTHSPE